MDVDATLLVALKYLTPAQKSKLATAQIRTVKELLIAQPSDLARKLKIGLPDVLAIIDAVCRELERLPRPLGEIIDEVDNLYFSTGSDILDNILGKGIQTAMIWEFCGESSAGKTQLALQLSLMVQLPPDLGGISGSCCYITARGQLATTRLTQLIEEHPRLSAELVSLSNVHTSSASTPETLLNMLTYGLTRLINLCSQHTNGKPIRLIILDSIAALFVSKASSSTKDLVQRSKLLSEIAARFRALAVKHRLAIVIINEVRDVFQHAPEPDIPDVINYHQQIQWVTQADSLPGENRKEAALALVWSNQINARIMMTKTARRIDLTPDENPPNKRLRLEPAGAPMVTYEGLHDKLENTVLLRRMTVIFSAVGKELSADYCITSAGVKGLSLADARRRMSRRVGHELSTTLSPASAVPDAQLGNSPLLEDPSVEASDGIAADVEYTDHDSEFLVQAESDPTIDPEEALWEQQPDLSQFISAEEEQAASTTAAQDRSNHPNSGENETPGDEDALWLEMPDLSQFIPEN